MTDEDAVAVSRVVSQAHEAGLTIQPASARRIVRKLGFDEDGLGGVGIEVTVLEEDHCVVVEGVAHTSRVDSGVINLGRALCTTGRRGGRMISKCIPQDQRLHEK